MEPFGSKENVIQWFIDTRGFTSYLEIGCYHDGSFNPINCAKKVGVDPHTGGTVRMTSDDFFAQNTDRFDVVLIDGNHHHDFVYRDIGNSLACLTPNGVIVMHDCMPPDEIHEDPFRCGTGWRAFAHYRQFPNLDAATGSFDIGVGVILQRPNSKIITLSKPFSELRFEEMTTEGLMRFMPGEALRTFIEG